MIRVNAAGCSLVDNLYGRISFDSEAYRRYRSRTPGDGGLSTGGLVFSEALADFAGRPYSRVLADLTGGSRPDSSNIGGPGIVPLIHAEQVRRREDIRYRFAGVVGRDANGRRFRDLLKRSGFSDRDYRESDSPTPGTDVLSDPDFDGGRGERTFINTIGAAAAFGPKELPEDFFDADIILFGATALVPPLHDALDELCRRGRRSGAFVMVNTVFDFRSEARMKGRPWPLVEDYGSIDLLALDREEARKISGRPETRGALDWFLDRGCGAVLITQGADDVLLGSKEGGRFAAPGRDAMPTCRYADRVISTITTPRDTTGCGDNFVGGLLDAVAHQSAEGRRTLDLEDAVVQGIAAGSLALTCLGGVYYEDRPGEKRSAMDPFLMAYRRQLAEG